MDEKPTNPKLVIEFESPHSVQFKAQINDVTALQLLALAAWLEFEGKFQLNYQKNMQLEMMQRQEESRLTIAKPGIILPGQRQ